MPEAHAIPIQASIHVQNNLPNLGKAARNFRLIGWIQGIGSLLAIYPYPEKAYSIDEELPEHTSGISSRFANVNIELEEQSVCVKVDGLPEIYKQIKAAATASELITIPWLINLLLSTERNEQSGFKIFDARPAWDLKNEIRSLNTARNSPQFRKATTTVKQSPPALIAAL